MPIGKLRSTGEPTTPDELDELLECRMAMLGLHFDAAENGDGDTLDAIIRRCRSCDYRDACAVDLKRDPNNPVWESYCPNAGTLVDLAAAQWITMI